MKCTKCGKYFAMEECVMTKVHLVGESVLDIHCDDCGRCCICHSGETKELTRCKTCGFQYHTHHTGDALTETEEKENYTCTNCKTLLAPTEYQDLVGQEVPQFERDTEEVDKETFKKITDIIRKHKAPTKSTEGIKRVCLESVKLDPLFSSPFPEEYTRYPTLYLCGGCLEYFSAPYVLSRHKKKCAQVYPPGRLLYLDPDKVGVFEVEGSKKKSYCQSLCLLAKMFLNHKTLYYDVEPFLFYVIGEVQNNRFTMQGYFSKERGEGSNNLSCIVVFPPYRNTGLGSFLIDFSYHLTKRTTDPPYTKGPEQPLSKEGERAYLSYWCDTLLRYISFKKKFAPDESTFASVSEYTGIATDAVKQAYAEIAKRFPRPPMYHDIITSRDLFRRSRRLKKWSFVESSVEQKDKQ